jgi:hypothetical protein
MSPILSVISIVITSTAVIRKVIMSIVSVTLFSLHNQSSGAALVLLAAENNMLIVAFSVNSVYDLYTKKEGIRLWSILKGKLLFIKAQTTTSEQRELSLTSVQLSDLY